MCDYSLQGLPNRLAAEGEQLVTYRFRTGSIGLASPFEVAARQEKRRPSIQDGWWGAFKRWLSGTPQKDELCAVCIPPGTRLLMSRIPDRMRREAKLRAVEDVTFVQLSAEAFQYRDAVRFADGRELTLQSIPANVMFQVLFTGPREPAFSGTIDWRTERWRA